MTENGREPQQLLTPGGTIDHAIADMTVTFAADVTLAALQAQLAPHAQWLPIDGDPEAALGELVLRNSTGPLRLGYGAWRDVLLGAQFYNGHDELISAGGRVVKNVAGYDLTKLLVGSGGVFGAPATFTARTWRRPVGALHATVDLALLDRLTAVIASPLKPHWMLLYGARVTLAYHGEPTAVAYFKREVAALGPAEATEVSIEQDMALRAQLWSGSFSRRISVAPAHLLPFLGESQLGDSAVADPAFGIVSVARGAAVDESRLRSAAARYGAMVTSWDETGAYRSVCLPPDAYALLQRLKLAFDPDGAFPALPPNQT